MVYADADLEKAAAAAPSAVFGNAGQDCCARSRILVERSALDRFMEVLEESVEAIRVGDPLDEATEMGPLISEGQRETVLVVRPRRRAGGDPRERARRPRLLVPAHGPAPRREHGSRRGRGDLRPGGRRDPVRDEEEAIRLANETIYGLSGSVWTRDGAKALRTARAIESGVVSINSNTSVRVSTPFGGFKQSGYGRELGLDALDHDSEVKNVYDATEG